MAGSSGEVARYKLGNLLAQASPYLLLLSATPHNGKTEPFLRLIRLLDADAFPNAKSIVREQVAPFLLSLIHISISWLYQQLDPQFCGPQTYAELQPKFMQEVKAVDKYEQMPELATILEENFLQDENGRWYIPDVTKVGDLVKLREKNLWKEFESYMNSKGKLKLFRSEAIRVGFSRLWKEKNYKAIVDIAERLPEQTIQEDSNLLMYYDISLGRV